MAKEKPTTKLCKHCKSEIPYEAKICPQCRKKQGVGCLGVILIVIGAFIVLGACGAMMGGKSDSSAKTETKVEAAAPAEKTDSAKSATQETVKETEAPIEYMPVDLDAMMDELENNALKAQDTYKNQYIELTGKLGTIDSSGDYIALLPNRDFAIVGIHCTITNDEQKAQVANMESGCMVTLRGKCTDVGEFLGYTLKIDSIDGFDGEAATIDLPTSGDGYITVTADELVDIIGTNSLKAQNTFKGQQIAVTGKLGTIDSNGKYFNIDSDVPFSFTNIQCYIKSDDQKSAIMELNKGDIIVVKGKCKDVGELLGYSIDVESIE